MNSDWFAHLCVDSLIYTFSHLSLTPFDLGLHGKTNLDGKFSEQQMNASKTLYIKEDIRLLLKIR